MSCATCVQHLNPAKLEKSSVAQETAAHAGIGNAGLEPMTATLRDAAE
jgi:hypothetical protein